MNTAKKYLIWVFLCPAVFALAITNGCSLGPDYSRPLTPAAIAQEYVNELCELQDGGPNEIGPWWRHFGDPVTGELVDEAIKNNYDLKAAAARVLQAEKLLTVARGGRLPQVDYAFNRTRSKFAIDLPTVGLQSALSTTFTQDITVSYVVDLFGRLKRTEEAAWADLFAAKWDRTALIHSIISQVVSARIQIASLQRQLLITRQNTQNWQRTLELIERRYSNGLIGPLDVRLARENLAASEASETIFEQQLHQAEYALDVLVGRSPAASKSLPATLAELPNIDRIPAGVPVSLLDRRPDLRASEMRLAAATARQGVSVAQLYPDLTLTAASGYRSSEFGDLLSKDYEVYSAIINAAQPIFRGGQLRAQVGLSEVKVEEAAANYAQAVLVALREVEDALMRERILWKRYDAVKSRLKEAVAAERLAKERYSTGLIQLVTVLETQRRRRVAEIELVLTQAALWNVRVDFFLALGGDWHNEAIIQKSGEVNDSI